MHPEIRFDSGKPHTRTDTVNERIPESWNCWEPLFGCWENAGAEERKIKI